MVRHKPTALLLPVLPKTWLLVSKEPRVPGTLVSSGAGAMFLPVHGG